MASEYLEYTNCKRWYISCSDAVLNQLILRQRLKFPAVLTYQQELQSHLPDSECMRACCILFPVSGVSVYLRDVMSRTDDIKAKLTSTFGTVLKLDSIGTGRHTSIQQRLCMSIATAVGQQLVDFSVSGLV